MSNLETDALNPPPLGRARAEGSSGARRFCDAGPSAGPSGRLLPQEKGKSAGHRMRFLILAILLFAIALPAFAIDPLPFKNDAQRQRFQHLTSQLRCMVCQNESLEDSNADLARDLRRQVFQMMQAGKSDEQIKQYLVARYSDFVLYDPPLKASTIALWFAPPALVVIGGIVVFMLLRKRARPAMQIAANETGDDW